MKVEIALKVAGIGFWKKIWYNRYNFGSGVEFLKSYRVKVKKDFNAIFLMINKVWLINDLSSINWIKIKNTFEWGFPSVKNLGNAVVRK